MPFKRVTKSADSAFDSSTPIRWVATELEKVSEQGRTIRQLAAHYHHGLHGDPTRIQLHELKATIDEMRRLERYGGTLTRAATEWLIGYALPQLERNEHGERQIIEQDDAYRLAVLFDDLRLVSWRNDPWVKDKLIASVSKLTRYG